jgi:lipopolysaccharide export LptBFGC system permease protein LptF
MEARGRPADAERLVLLKRTTLALSTPLLAALALPLGGRVRRVVPLTVGVIIGVWALQRACDHLAGHWGASTSAAVPLAILGIATVLAWRGWGPR